MRKLIGLLAIMFTVFVVSSPAAAEEQPLEDPTYTVECTMLNFTDPSLKNEDGSYDTGTPINLEAMLVDPENRVGHIVFAAGTEQKGGIIQEDSITTVTWTPDIPGDWTVGALLYESDGTEIGTTGDCDVTITVVGEPVIEPDTDHEPGPCDEANPRTIVQRDDGSTDYLVGDVVCESVLPKVVTPTPAAPLAELPRTGSGITALAITGLALIAAGCWCLGLVKHAHKQKLA